MRRFQHLKLKCRSIAFVVSLMVAAGLLISSSLPATLMARNTTLRIDSPRQHRKKSQQKKSDNKCTRCSPPGDQLIYIPLIDLPEARGGEIVFNSRSPEAMNVTPVFYQRSGETVIGEPITIQSAEIRYVKIKDLMPARYRHQKNWGGFALSYYGANRQMWSQFRFLGVNGGANVDEFFTVKEESRSEVYEAAWWTPNKSEAIVALGNITDVETSATVRFSDGHPQNGQFGTARNRADQARDSKRRISVRED
jgi:hypothetical protein